MATDAIVQKNQHMGIHGFAFDHQPNFMYAQPSSCMCFSLYVACNSEGVEACAQMVGTQQL
jgi:hypothetical protein